MSSNYGKKLEYRFPVSIVISRPMTNVIEYSVTIHDPLSGDETRVYHANRYATFHGPFDGAFQRQVTGAAHTLWREDDVDCEEGFRGTFHSRGYSVREVTFA